MLLGDSHAAHWQPAVDAFGQQHGVKVVVRTYGGCPAIDAPVALQGTSKAEYGLSSIPGPDGETHRGAPARRRAGVER